MTRSTFDRCIPPLAVLAIVAATPLLALADNLHTKLDGYEEVPAVSTQAEGKFKAHFDHRTQTISYELRSAGRQRYPGAHSLWPKRRQRRHQRIPVHQPR